MQRAHTPQRDDYCNGCVTHQLVLVCGLVDRERRRDVQHVGAAGDRFWPAPVEGKVRLDDGQVRACGR